jgi:hypothetical protein
MLSEYATVGGQVFSVSDDGKRLHVIPQRAADETGRMMPQTPILDTLITIAPKQRNGVALLAAICEAVSASTGVKVEVGTVPANLLAQYRTSVGVKNQPARQAMTELLDALHGTRTLVWDLYDDSDGYALNIN